MSQGVVARRYAKALISLSLEQKVLEESGEHLCLVAEAFNTSVYLKELMENNRISVGEKEIIMGKILKKLKISELIKTFCRFLLSKKRMELLTAIHTIFDSLLKEQLGRLEAKVVVTHPLSDTNVQTLEQNLSFLTGKKVNVEASVDPNLIGGIITRIGSTVFDGSIRNQLNQIRQTISQGGIL